MAVFTTTASSTEACIDTTVGGATANSYISRNDLLGYLRCRVNVDSAGNSDDLLAPLFTVANSNEKLAEAYLIRGTFFIDEFGDRFVGERAAETQSLEWPRDNACRGKRTFKNDIIPDEVKVALVYACGYLHAKADPYSKTPPASATVNEANITEKSYLRGLLVTKYWAGSGGSDDRNINYYMRGVRSVLNPLLISSFMARRA